MKLNGTGNSERAVMSADLSVGIALLAMIILPLCYTWLKGQRILHIQYYRAAAMQVVDGEMEVLTAGEWRTVPQGTNDYPVNHASLKKIASGKLISVRNGKRIRLEWIPNRTGYRVTREVEFE